MPNILDVFPSKYLKSHELQGKTPTVTIARVAVEQVRGKVAVERKAVVYFRGHTKGLLLNKTNARSIIQIARSGLTEHWPGVAITLYATTATFGTEVHTVIRIKAPTPVQTVTSKSMVSKPMVSQSRPRVFTDELEIDLADAGGVR